MVPDVLVLCSLRLFLVLGSRFFFSFLVFSQWFCVFRLLVLGACFVLLVLFAPVLYGCLLMFKFGGCRKRVFFSEPYQG